MYCVHTAFCCVYFLCICVTYLFYAHHICLCSFCLMVLVLNNIRSFRFPEQYSYGKKKRKWWRATCVFSGHAIRTSELWQLIRRSCWSYICQISCYLSVSVLLKLNCWGSYPKPGIKTKYEKVFIRRVPFSRFLAKALVVKSFPWKRFSKICSLESILKCTSHH